MKQYHDNYQTPPLTHLILQYYKKIVSYEKLHKAICSHIYDFPKKITTRYSEYAGDFLLYMEPKIEKIVTTFTFCGIPFENYLNVTLRYQYMSFIKQHILSAQKNLLYEDKNACYSINMPTHVSENHEDMISESPNTIKMFYALYLLLQNYSNSKTYRIRLWWLILKHSTIIPEAHITEFAHLLNMPIIPCMTVLKKLRTHIQKALDKKEKIESTSNQYFGKCRFIELQLHRSSLTQHEIIELERKRDRYHKKYIAEVNKLQNINFSISNNTLSILLGSPKGSIDSGLFWLKQYCKKFSTSAREKGLI